MNGGLGPLGWNPWKGKLPIRKPQENPLPPKAILKSSALGPVALTLEEAKPMKQDFSISKTFENFDDIKNTTEKEKVENSEILETPKHNETTIVKIASKTRKFTRTNGPMVDLSDLFRSRKVEENEKESETEISEEISQNKTVDETSKFFTCLCFIEKYRVVWLKNNNNNNTNTIKI